MKSERTWRRWLPIILSLVLMAAISLVGCTPNEDPDEKDAKSYKVEYNTEYEPTTFDASTANYKVTKLGVGVYLVANKFKLNDAGSVTNRNTTVWTIEVDLNKADIVAGCHNNAIPKDVMKSIASSPYSHGQAWEKDTGGHVYATINADFFGEFGPINAFVKDGVIVRDGHCDFNPLEGYDYTNTKADVPASAPMLFGVKGNEAQIAPIMNYTGDPTNAEVKKSLVQARLTYDADKKVKSPDGLWDGYTQILGCRQALIIDGEIPFTVALENTNGAQRTDIPRSAVGIKPDGKVVVFAVEAMRYYNRSTKATDPYGLSLPELADFMKFYGIQQGANFDGGGSTHLAVRGAKEKAAHTVVRSADFAADRTAPGATRSVKNSLLVTNKLN